MDLEKYLKEKGKFVNSALLRLVPSKERHPKTLYGAMSYSLFAGGKRLRPILVIASAEASGGEVTEGVVRAACAFECVHTYSLIHDDLPSMDDDDLRRGIPTCHKKFGEAAAILAGDALLTVAFELMAGTASDSAASNSYDAERTIGAIAELARGAGHGGMVGGQMADIESEGGGLGGGAGGGSGGVDDGEVDFATVEYIHTRKTGALILASVRCGAILAGASEADLKALTRYGESVGLAFQVADDILDIEGSTEELGKSTGSDEKRSKATYPALVGVAESKSIAAELVERALKSLDGFDKKADPLRAVAAYIINRKN